jgi:hypothetical protein
MTAVDESQRGPSCSRGRFLARLGLGAAAVAGGSTVAPGRAAASSPAGVINSSSFTRLFPELPPFAGEGHKIERALVELGRPGGLLDANDPLSAGPIELITNPALSLNNPNNPTHTAAPRSSASSSTTTSRSTSARASASRRTRSTR